MSTLLETRKLTKRFGGIIAVKEVDFKVEKGVIKGLIGPNGSGKTTLINCITGVHRPDEGRVFFESRDITGLPPHRVAKIGIARTWQIVRPFKKMTVLEAVMTSALIRVKDLSVARSEAVDVLKLLGFTEELMNRRGSDITLVQHKLVDLARAIVLKPKLLFVDEIAAGLRPVEVEGLIDLLRRVHRELDITMVVVEHLMTFIMKLSDDIAVMHEGQLIAEGSPEEVAKNPRVVEVYLGMRV
ncbi:MAG: ABC transporter ATP-binding protein [Thermosphaera sp.]|nr:ABC transporter ATP-binding protein [Thermosphaera sp.]